MWKVAYISLLVMCQRINIHGMTRDKIDGIRDPMKEKITAAVIQMDVVKGCPDLNLAKATTLIREAREMGAELVVLPEMWLTDFVLKDPFPLLPWSAKALDSLVLIAQKGNMVIVAGSIMEESKGQIYNTSYVITSEGVVGKYRKAHIFAPMGEGKVFKPGGGTYGIETSLARLGTIICYDLRFPEHIRSLALQGVEILCVPAQWPLQRITHWEILLRARAIENQFFVLGCNRCGKTGTYHFPGHSLIIDPLGRILATAQEEGIALATLEKAVMEEYRAQIPSLKDSLLLKR